MGSGDIAGICGAKVEVLKGGHSWCICGGRKNSSSIAFKFGLHAYIEWQLVPVIRNVFAGKFQADNNLQ